MQRNFNLLGRDLLCHFASTLGYKDHVSLSAVNKYLYGALKGDKVQHLWRHRYRQHFPDFFAYMEDMQNVNWYAEFAAAFLIHCFLETPRQWWLFACMRRGDIVSLQQGSLLHQMAPLNVEDLFISDGCWPLLDTAIMLNNQALLDYMYLLVQQPIYLLGDPDDVNINLEIGSYKMRLIHCAAMFKQGRDTLITLIENGAYVCIVNEFRQTPLHFAALYGDIVSVECLLEHHPNVTAVDHFGYTPFTCSLIHGNYHIALRLYAHEVNDRAFSLCSSLYSFFTSSIGYGFSFNQEKAAVNALVAVVENGADPSILEPHLPALQNGRLGEIFRGLGFSTQWNGEVVRMQRRL